MYLDSISHVSDCGDVPRYYSEIEPLTEIKSFIEKNPLQGKTGIELKNLCEKIEDVCKKLKNTHKN